MESGRDGPTVTDEVGPTRRHCPEGVVHSQTVSELCYDRGHVFFVGFPVDTDIGTEVVV